MRHVSFAAVFFVALTACARGADLDVKGTSPAIGSDGELVAVVLADNESLACAVSNDGGLNFAAPLPVGKVAPGQMLGMRRGPKIAVRGKTILIVTNSGKGRTIPAFRSVDAGKTWQYTAAIDDPAGRSAEGLLDLAPTREGFAVVYLDLIGKVQCIAVARSIDDGKTFAKSQLAYTSPDGSVCECCQPTITSDRAGNVAVMFRNNLAGNRDMYLGLSKDDGKTFAAPAKLGTGTWKLNGCPMDGGNLTFVDKSVLAVFRRQNTLFTVRPGEAETEIATGKSAVVASTVEGPVLAWESQNGVTVRVAKSDTNIDNAIAPVLTAASGGVVLAYSGPDARTHTRVVWQAKAP